jgi:hypothetical protein
MQAIFGAIIRAIFLYTIGVTIGQLWLRYQYPNKEERDNYFREEHNGDYARLGWYLFMSAFWITFLSIFLIIILTGVIFALFDLIRIMTPSILSSIKT